MDDSPLEGIGSLIRLSGVHIPSRARFVGETLISTTLSALTLGFVCGQAGSALASGPLLPFLIGSWTGYSLGILWYWRACRRLTHTYAVRYPSLLAHALFTEHMVHVPKSVVQASIEKQQQEHENEFAASSSAETLDMWIVNGGIQRLSFSILAAQSCRGDVEEVERLTRQKLMEEHIERLASES